MTKRKRKTISEYLADRIIRNQMRVKFSTAHADFLQQEQQMSDDLSNNAAPLRKNAVGTPADAQKMRSDATGAGYTVPSIIPVTIKDVDSKDLITGEDTRAEAQGGTSALRGNDSPVRSQTGTKGA